jgi:ribosome-interacting GTPase 1
LRVLTPSGKLVTRAFVAMPANLTPEYRRAEARYRAAKTVEEKIAALEEMLRVIPKHKGTDGLQGDLKARLAKLRREPKKGPTSGQRRSIPREGAAQVALVGPPNTGKSALVAALTRATPVVADYPFTTREPTPGMMPFEDIAFQLVDLPPLAAAHVDPWVFDLVRAADLAWVVVDGAAALEGWDEVRTVLRRVHIGLQPAGRARVPTDPDVRHETDALVVVTKLDRPDAAGAVEALDDLLGRRWLVAGVSTATGAGLEALKRVTFEASGIIRVYTKEPGRPADRSTPFTLRRGSTVGDLAARIHKDLAAAMTFARVWGPSAFDGATVHRDHVLAEGDVVEIHV